MAENYATTAPIRKPRRRDIREIRPRMALRWRLNLVLGYKRPVAAP
jgi:hypothetical protein